MKIKKNQTKEKKLSRITIVAISIAVFYVLFFIGAFRLLDKMKFIPGDLGNAQKFSFALQSILIK